MLRLGEVDVAIAVYPSSVETVVLQNALRRMASGDAAELALSVTQEGNHVEYCVRVAAAPKLVIVGGGHIGRVLAQMMVSTDFRVTVLDDRFEFANEDRFPPPIAAVAGDIAATLEKWSVDANTYVVIVTRGHKHDEAALKAVISSPACYLGMIGSRRKVQVVFDDLRRDGASEDQLARVHAPIGLEIGAVTAQELALSIAAQLVSVRRTELKRKCAGPAVISSVNP
jgi:xanthine dehydrogenase accessory factor